MFLGQYPLWWMITGALVLVAAVIVVGLLSLLKVLPLAAFWITLGVTLLACFGVGWLINRAEAGV